MVVGVRPIRFLVAAACTLSVALLVGLPSAFAIEARAAALTGHPAWGAENEPPSVLPEPRSPVGDPTKLIRQYANPPVFLLHSKPGSNKTIYLDFDGEVLTSTRWNETFKQSTLTVAEFDVDATPGLGDRERAWIYTMWLSIAEDMAPFDVDVTTERPSNDALTRSFNDPTFGQVITFTSTNLFPETNTATAWFGSFGTAGLNTGFVFTGEQPTQPNYYASLAAWAIGHSLGLPNRGAAGTAFYQGTQLWGPIMGAAWSNWNTQWSRGEYQGATNPGFDEIAVIRATLGTRPDDHPAGAVVRNFTTGPPERPEVKVFPESYIEQVGDTDMFEVFTDPGFLHITLDTSPRPNLMPRLRLVGPEGEIAAVTGLFGTSLTQGGLAPGWYRIEVSAAGRPVLGNEPAVSAYGSLGVYQLRINPYDQPFVASVSFSGFDDQAMEATWPAATTRSTGQQIRYEVTVCEVTCRYINAGAGTRLRFVAERRSGPVKLSIQAIDQFGNGRSLERVVMAPVLSRPDAPGLVRVVPTNEGRTLRIVWAAGQSYAPVMATGLEVSLRADSSYTQTVVVPPNASEVSIDTPSLGAWVDVSLRSRTDHPAPWDVSRNVTTLRVPLQRIEAPQAPPTSSTPGTSTPTRPTVPQTETPVSSTPRPSVPQA
jgi:hypothetical protein